MEQIAIWRRLAEKWREAADEVAEPTLRHCYVQRAATYEQLVAREDSSGRRPAISWKTTRRPQGRRKEV